MTHLSEIAAKGNSDKGMAFHCYTEKYNELFKPIRLKPITLLEVGILGGDSLEMWSEFFPHSKARIIGVDIHDRGYRSKDPRVELYFGDVMQQELLGRIQGDLTVVVEDGSHMASHQIDTFRNLWPRVVPGGIWITEDLHVCHSVQHRDCHQTMIQFLAQVAEQMQDPAGATGSGAYDPSHPWSDIASIELSKGLAVIRKRL